MMKRPVTVTILGLLYIAVGAIGTAAHYAHFHSSRPSANELVWVTVLGLIAIVAGAFMLRGHDWARWLALAWMAFHVALSVFHPLHELIVHTVLLVLFAYLLFRPEARAYFRSGKAGA
ncbi:MAG: hypothetical protein WBE38_17345 [Terracidiphilus sp.]|jgi:hypothetical protein